MEAKHFSIGRWQWQWRWRCRWRRRSRSIKTNKTSKGRRWGANLKQTLTWLLGLALVAVVLLNVREWFNEPSPSPQPPAESQFKPASRITLKAPPDHPKAPVAKGPPSEAEFVDKRQAKNSPVQSRTTARDKENKEPGELILPYVLDDGLAVVQGDVVIGRPTDPNAGATGQAVVPELHLWPTSEIAYHIQPGVPNPDRIVQALKFFDGTAVHFVPLTNERDSIVFEETKGICKSYVGWIGGNQPIWLNPECGPTEVAHEILHALGFVHEQNRVDRDTYLRVDFDSIEENHRSQFDKLTEPFMKVSGLAPFDYGSLMLYPVSMFAKPGHSTMESVIQGRSIMPGRRLSAMDVDRLNRAYGR
ncbi:MAG: hypothetical protein C5B49_09530 [Bdellovibrio sp.]|nr:MAG: hypothetical protein C5B49_09530 [Bdellovibrio sp.]